MGLLDDIAYVTILFASIGLGKIVRLIPPEESDGVKIFRLRRVVSTIFGLLVAWCVSGWAILHLLVQILGAGLILTRVNKKVCHLVCLIWCFSYLFFFRLSISFGLPPPPPHTNAIIMILTLKLVGLAYELNDTYLRQDVKKRQNTDPTPAYEDVEFSWTGLVDYTLGHVGLITGPYYKYSTWRGVTVDPWNPATRSNQWQWGLCESAALARAKCVPLYVTAFLVSGYLFPLSIVETQEWQQNSSFLWKMFYMMPVFFNFRMRIYSGFILSECSCIMAGLGAYPSISQPRPGQGPTNTNILADWGQEGIERDVDFETVHNINEWSSDFAPSMREALRSWNMTVQYWLVTVVYKRFPIKSLRTVAVMLTSSVWHGVHPGYYLSLGSVPFCLLVEDLYRKIVREKISLRGQAVYDRINWFVRMRWFDYLGMGFLLLRIDKTVDYWTGVWFVGHVSLAVGYLMGIILVKPFMSRRNIEKDDN